MMEPRDHRRNLLRIFSAGIDAVKGDNAVYQALQAQGTQPASHVIAIGKAAEAMYQGARRYFDGELKSALLISKYGHYSSELLADKQVIALEAAHPVPAESSLQAGQALLEHLERLPAGEPCLVLISGGASSVCEVLAEDWSLADLQQLTRELLADGYDIHAMNAIRQRLSRIKGGKLWHFLGQRPVQALLISDVQGDEPASIGSGLLFPPDPHEQHFPDDLPTHWQQRLPPVGTIHVPDSFQWQIVASNQLALAAMQQRASILGYDVAIVERFLAGQAVQEAHFCLAELASSQREMLLWGGETTVFLPENPGRGGRNQHFALSAANALPPDSAVLLLAGGTDGSDGLSDDAGAMVDAQTVPRGELAGLDAMACLRQANAGVFLEASGDLIHTGPTGTNVMDVVIGLKQ